MYMRHDFCHRLLNPIEDLSIPLHSNVRFILSGSGNDEYIETYFLSVECLGTWHNEILTTQVSKQRVPFFVFTHLQTIESYNNTSLTSFVVVSELAVSASPRIKFTSWDFVLHIRDCPSKKNSNVVYLHKNTIWQWETVKLAMIWQLHNYMQLTQWNAIV